MLTNGFNLSSKQSFIKLRTRSVSNAHSIVLGISFSGTGSLRSPRRFASGSPKLRSFSTFEKRSKIM